jgi:hypothetical protein
MGEALHLLRRQTAAIEYNGDRVAAIGKRGEDVDLVERARDSGSLASDAEPRASGVSGAASSGCLSIAAPAVGPARRITLNASCQLALRCRYYGVLANVQRMSTR